MTSLTDRPQEDADAKTIRDNRYNFTIGVIDGVGWPLSMAFFSTTTLLPAFLLRLHASVETIGWLSAVLTLGYMMPAGLVAAKSSRLAIVRSQLFSTGIVERVPLFLIALLTAVMGASRPNVLVAAMFALLAIHSIALGTNQILYWRAIAKVIPTNQRGRMFGLAGLIGGCLGFGVEPVSRLLLLHNHGNGLDGYALCFFVGACIQFFSFLPFNWLREPLSDTSQNFPDSHAGHYIRDSIRIWRENGAFRLLLIASSTIGVATAGEFFLYAGANARYHLGPKEIALFTTISVVSGAFGSLAWGTVADRFGNKIVLVLSGIAYAIGVTLAFANPTVATYDVVFAMTALGGYGWGMAAYNILLEFAAHEQETAFYVAMSNGTAGVIHGIAPIMGGVIAHRLGYPVLFAGCTVFAVAAVLMTLPIKEPRHAPAQPAAG